MMEPGCPIELSGKREGFYSLLGHDEVDLYKVELSKGELIHVFLIIPDKILTSVRVPLLEIADIKFYESGGGEWTNSASYNKWLLAQEAVFEAPEDGVYEISVYDSVGEPGDYALVFDGADPVHLFELIRLVIGTLRLNI